MERGGQPFAFHPCTAPLSYSILQRGACQLQSRSSDLGLGVNEAEPTSLDLESVITTQRTDKRQSHAQLTDWTPANHGDGQRNRSIELEKNIDHHPID